MKLVLPNRKGYRTGAMLASALGVITLLLLTVAMSGPETSASASGSVATATVTRMNLLDTRTQTGTLGFGDPVDVPFISKARSGIVTWMAPEGSVVKRGEPLFAIDGQPVVLLYGELPAFRTLRFDGASFDDFEWLELNNAKDDQHKAELNVELQRSRLAEHKVRLDEAELHQDDSEREQPVTPQFIRLTQAVAAARDRLGRIEKLSKSGYTTPEDLQKVRYELASAQAELDAATRDRTQQAAMARSSVAEAELALLEAQRQLRDANDDLNALLSIANHNADITLLRENLKALGYEGNANEVIRQWQIDAGRSATGLVEPGQVVVAQGPVRMAEHLVDAGDIVFGGNDMRSALPSNNGADLLVRYTSMDKRVTVPLEVADHAYARVGDEVMITLPTNAEISGVITKVSTVFNAQGVADATIEIPDQTDLGALEAGLVDVEFVVGSKNDVLAVPISALRALPAGGYGVAVVEGEVSQVIPVTTGLFARGNVEISGDGVNAGLAVEIAQ